MQRSSKRKLKEPETRKYLANAFRDGEIKTVGTDIDKLMPPVSRFGGGGRAQKKQGVIDKLKGFFDKFFELAGWQKNKLQLIRRRGILKWQIRVFENCVF